MGILGSLCLINIDDPTKPLSKTVVADGFNMRHISTHDLCSQSEQMDPYKVHSTVYFMTVLVLWCSGGHSLKSGIRSLLKCVPHSENGPTCTPNTKVYKLGLLLHLQYYLIRKFLCLYNPEVQLILPRTSNYGLSSICKIKCEIKKGSLNLY